MNENILKDLKFCREQRGLTLRELSSISGISKSYLFHLENGNKTNPSFKILLKICNALNMDISFIFKN